MRLVMNMRPSSTRGRRAPTRRPVKHTAVSFRSLKPASLALVAVVGAPLSRAQTVVTDTWSGVPAGQTGGAWLATRDALAAQGVTSGTNWTGTTAWTNAGQTPHAFSFVADAGSTGGAGLGVTGQTKYPFASASTYFNTNSGVSPVFAVEDAGALAVADTISLTIIGLNNSLNAAPEIGVAPVLSVNGEAAGFAADEAISGVSGVVMFGTTYYRFTTFTWDVASLDVVSFSVGWTGASTANYIHEISLTQTAAAVPEPSAFAGLAGAAVLAGAVLRRRRRA